MKHENIRNDHQYTVTNSFKMLQKPVTANYSNYLIKEVDQLASQFKRC